MDNGNPAATNPENGAEAAIRAEQDRALSIMAACQAAGVPMMAATLIRDGVSAEQAQARITAEGERVTAIRAKVEQARKVSPLIEASLADTYIAAGSSPEAVADELLNRIAAISASAPQRGSHSLAAPGDQTQVSASWDKIVDRINAQRGLDG